MAFTQGQLITADELNNVNDRASRSISFPTAADWIQDYIGNGGKFYSHRKSGTAIFRMRLDCGWFGGGNILVEKLDASGNVIATLLRSNYGWSTHTTVTVNSTGPGWYRARSDTAFQFDATTIYLWEFQNDCTPGKQLTYYDNPATSGNRITGTPLTVSVLNSGRAGTINTP